jgi:preprotein translocase subunit SecF
MELFNPNSNVDFMGLRRWTAAFSILICLFSLLALASKGLHWGLDFTGGIQVVVKYDNQVPNIDEIRTRLNAEGFQDAQVMNYGTTKTVMISIGPRESLTQSALVDKMMKVLPGAQKERVDIVGPQVGKELATKGALAVLVSLIALLIYIAMRFEFKLSVSATVALIHDPVLILGIFAFWGLEFDLKALAGLLAVIGYSLNDTIVVFDRVRENFSRVRRAEPMEIMNLSINQTLSRTIMTSVLTLFVVVALLAYGGETLRGFSLALAIGIVIGTYSSIYVAGALAMWLGLNRQDFIPTTPKMVDDRP